MIFLTVVLAVSQMNLPQLGKMGGKLLLYYLTTTALAVLIGVSLALFFNPGEGITLPDASVDKPDIPHFSDILLQIVPRNLFAAFTAGDLMAILFVAIIIGMAVSTMLFSSDEKMRDHGAILDRFFTAMNEMFYRLLNGIFTVCAHRRLCHQRLHVWQPGVGDAEVAAVFYRRVLPGADRSLERGLYRLYQLVPALSRGVLQKHS